MPSRVHHMSRPEPSGTNSLRSFLFLLFVLQWYCYQYLFHLNFPFEKEIRNELGSVWPVECWAIKKNGISLVSGEREKENFHLWFIYHIYCVRHIFVIHLIIAWERKERQKARTELIESAHLSTNLIFLSPQLDSGAWSRANDKTFQNNSPTFPPVSYVRRWRDNQKIKKIKSSGIKERQKRERD